MYIMYDELFAKRLPQDGKIVDVVGLPTPGPWEVAYDLGRRRIWCACLEAGVYLLHPETGSYEASFPLPGEIPSAAAICYDRDTPSAPLWVTDALTWRLWNLTTNGSIARSVRVSITGKTGLAFDNDTAGGPYIFIGAYSNKARIYAGDPATGSVLYSFDAPVKGTRLHGATWDGDYLWTIDSDNGYVVQFVAHEPNLTITPASVGRIRALYR
jgi:outer membrane protein assembly factor BamB